MLPVKESCEQLLTRRLGREIRISDFRSIGGGCINHAGKISTNAGDFFIKWNDAHRYPGMFEAEARGLGLLRETSAIRVPEVIALETTDQDAYIVLEYLESRNKIPDFFETFGRQLARMHQHSHHEFGLDHSNYIGSLPQSNEWASDWPQFYIDQRLIPQVQRAVDDHRITARHVKQFEGLYRRLPELFPTEVPALLHGDLWSGNFMADNHGEPCIYDPAVYYGHREIELAFTQLFGGYSPAFYEAYEHHFPLEQGFARRKDIYNLYPLMVHVNLFGGGYVASVESILSALSL